MSPRELRAIEARCAELHEERLADAVLREARAESERVRQRAGQQRSTPKPPTARAEKRCAECGGRTRAAGGTCADCLAAARTELVDYVRSCHYGATVALVAAHFEISTNTAAKRLERAVKAGALERVRVGRYAARRES